MQQILRWLGLTDEDHTRTGDPLATIQQALDALDPQKARALACFAYLLGRVARADHEVSAAEKATMQELVATHGGLTAEHAAIVADIATTQGLRFGGTDDFLVAREFAEVATEAEKLALLECLFAVSASDEAIMTVEDNEIRRIAAELRIGHQEVIDIRTRHARHLEVLRTRSPQAPE